jgi:hypothetical protein
MNRRGFLLTMLSGLVLWVVSRLPWSPHGAVFRVTCPDPDQGDDWTHTAGGVVYNAKRCCKNCQIITAAWQPCGDIENGPSFIHWELTPVNRAARKIMASVEASIAMQGSAKFSMAS